MKIDVQQENGFGNVDVHCHILPGLDDGPKEMERSIAMAEMAAADGTTHIVATPHSNFQFAYDPERIASLREQLQLAAGAQPQILIGCDFHLSYENIQDALKNPRKYSLNGSRYLLVEFPELFNTDAMASVLQQLLNAGLVPVLTHPERNPVFQQHRDLAARYIRMGCVLQITANSLTGDFGKIAEKMCFELLDRDLVHLVASDGHATKRRPPLLSAARALVVDRRGEETAAYLCSGNPAAMILDAELPYAPRPELRRKRGFWSFLQTSAR